MIEALGANKAFMAWLLAGIAAQTLKIILGVIRLKRFDFRWLIVTGGMPSTHAAGVSALTTSIGIVYGLESTLFAIAVAFTIITLFDAQGVRRSTGRQAQVLNKILENIYFKRRVNEGQVKELLGHTPLEVFAGMLIGILIALQIHSQ